MDRLELLPSSAEIRGNHGGVFILEAEAGSQRLAILGQWCEAMRAQGVVSYLMSTDFELGGPWAGLRDLLEELVPKLERQAPEILVQHDYELVTVLPKLRHKLSPRNPCLTDTAPENEQVRLYPTDRAFRILHGLIDLIAEWKAEEEPSQWLLVCDALDRGGYLVGKFFSELMRRRGRSCQLTLLAVCCPGEGDRVVRLFEPELLLRRTSLSLLPDPPAALDSEELVREAERLEAQAATDPEDIERYMPSLIRLWNLADRPSKALEWQLLAVTSYGHRGFYHDTIGYGEGALAHLEENCPDDEKLRLKLVVILATCQLSTGHPELALKLVVQALDRLKSPLRRGHLRYLLAMLHARYLPDRDLYKAEEQLDIALSDLQGADITHKELCFETAFNRNGLALIRYRQGRAAEALELCREAHRKLMENLSDGEHELHKSVLIYNQAQVFASLGKLDEAIDYYTSAMRVDPNYSEYYNERGNAFLKLGQLEAALADYQAAISLSAPYPEVRTNRGHCYRVMGNFEQAVQSYSSSLDLDPRQPRVLVVRAQCYESLGMVDPALADYDAALRLNPAQPLVLGNRASLLYQRGQIARALADLDRAVELSPLTEDLYRNRAVIFREAGEFEKAAADLESCLRLGLEGPDRDELEQELADLHSRASHAPVSEMARFRPLPS